MEWIISLADTVLKSYNNTEKTFAGAKNRLSIQVDSENKYIEYDTLSLCVYNHNLTYNEFYRFGQCLDMNINRNKERLKERYEYATLFHYALCNKDFDIYNATISKRTRPDFELQSDGRIIGVEITELTTPYDKILEKISLENKNTKATLSEVKEKAIKKYNEKAEDYEYYQINNMVAIGTKPRNITELKLLYVNNIIHKCNLYKDEISKYDKFIVLCNGSNCFALLNKEDIMDIWNTLSVYKTESDCFVNILYENSGNTYSSEYTLKTKSVKNY